MEKELSTYWDQIKSATGDNQKKLFIEYCQRLVKLKEKGELTEEEAADRMFDGIEFNNLTISPECESIFDIAGTTKVPRSTSYAQPIAGWNEKVANDVKQQEWRELVIAIEKANERTSLFFQDKI